MTLPALGGQGGLLAKEARAPEPFKRSQIWIFTKITQI